MAHLARSVASLRIAGDDLVPEEVSLLLGAQPTHAQRKGQELQSKNGVRIATFGHWRLHAKETEPENLDAQVAEILGQLTSSADVWQNLTARYRVDLFCGWFMEGTKFKRAFLVIHKTKDRGHKAMVDGSNNSQ